MRSARLWIPFRLPRPMKRRCRQHRHHHVVCMSILSAIPAERHHHIRLKTPYPLHQSPGSQRKLNKLQPPVMVVHQLAVRDAQHLARPPKLFPPHLSQRFTRRRITPVRRSLTIRHTDHIRFHTALGIKRQRSTKPKTLVVRMRSHTHQLQSHSTASRSASSNSSSGETIASTTASGSTSRTGAKLRR